MMLTWHQIAAYLEFNDKLERKKRADDLIIAAYGAQGDDKEIQKMAKELAR
jgi:hypothetical protein